MERIYDNKKITADDIRIWIRDFKNSFDVIEHLEERTKGDKEYLKMRMNEALFLVAYIESKLSVEVEDNVFIRAKELQR